MSARKATGSRGSWFAAVEGENNELPCLHKHWLKNLSYHDPFEVTADGPNQTKIREYVNGIAELGRVVLTNDKVHRDPQGVVTGFTRENYIAVFAVSHVQYSEVDGLRLKLTDRLYDLK